MHGRFGRRPPPLLPVARHTARDDVLPILPAALGDRQHMIEREVARWELVTAVLTLVVVTGINVRPRERHVVEPALDPDETEEPDHRRQLEADRNGANLAIVLRYDFDLPLAHQCDG